MRYVAASVVTDTPTHRHTRMTTVTLAHAPKVNKNNSIGLEELYNIHTDVSHNSIKQNLILDMYALCYTISQCDDDSKGTVLLLGTEQLQEN